MEWKYFKRILRGWLPQQPSTLQRIKQHSTPIAIGLLITLISVSAFASYTFISNVKPLPITPTVNETIHENTPTPEPTTPPLNFTNLTKEQALAIATPIIQQYATQNNRAITNITTNFGWGPDNGERGGLNLQQVLELGLSPSDSHNQFSYYPIWSVTATFQWERPGDLTKTDEQSYIIGYYVSIFADTGAIRSKGPNGVY